MDQPSQSVGGERMSSFKGHCVCDCRRCVPSGDSAEDYCYEIAFSIDEKGNYHDDDGQYRNGQTGEIIEEVSA